MDFFSHVIWTYLLFRSFGFDNSLVAQSVFFGLLPDLTFVIAGILLGSKYWIEEGKRPTRERLRSVFFMYRYSHSFVSFAAFLVISSLLFGSVYWPAFAWFLHILLDLWTHRGSPVEPQKPFFPLSDFSVRGWIWWRNPYFLIVNWALITIAYFGLQLG
ncbi:hypothetical protein KJ765_00065 [Candidatus Micrarchaeota archaeon]|nr:hypothetical protein [Candidatus Micrarchaeota archaeon]